MMETHFAYLRGDPVLDSESDIDGMILTTTCADCTDDESQ